ncbi:MAG: nucleotide exchange factor GrpE [Methylococcales bacterium]
MSTDQETPEVQVESENQSTEHNAHTEVAEHEYTVEELKQALHAAEQKAQKDLEDAHKFALTSFAKELLSVLDSLVLGLQAATGDSEDVQKFRIGSELTIKQFEAAFAKFKIETIDPMGQPFNAEQHQAMVMQEIEGAIPNTSKNSPHIGNNFFLFI